MFGDTLYLNYHRYALAFGFKIRPAGTSYERMTDAPPSGHRCENTEARKGLLLYCRVNGHSKGGVGCGKLLVEDVAENPPKDVEIIEKP